MVMFFGAGFDTSSTVISFALYEMALQQDIQQKLSEEIDNMLQKNGGKVTYEGIQEMTYLEKVVAGKCFVFTDKLGEFKSM